MTFNKIKELMQRFLTPILDGIKKVIKHPISKRLADVVIVIGAIIFMIGYMIWYCFTAIIWFIVNILELCLFPIYAIWWILTGNFRYGYFEAWIYVNTLVFDNVYKEDHKEEARKHYGLK